jgi:hypothetical protein
MKIELIRGSKYDHVKQYLGDYNGDFKGQFVVMKLLECQSCEPLYGILSISNDNRYYFKMFNVPLNSSKSNYDDIKDDTPHELITTYMDMSDDIHNNLKMQFYKFWSFVEFIEWLIKDEKCIRIYHAGSNIANDEFRISKG